MERPNVELPILRNFEISNLKNNNSQVTRFFISNFLLFSRFVKFFEYSKNIYDTLANWKFLEFRWFNELLNFENLLIFDFEQFHKFDDFRYCKLEKYIEFFPTWKTKI